MMAFGYTYALGASVAMVAAMLAAKDLTTTYTGARLACIALSMR
jgi:hypothetical protein